MSEPQSGGQTGGRALRTGIADNLIVEISTLLSRLAETGEEAAIDLRSLPMTEADRADLAHWLGHGEVRATLDVAGPSEIHETRFAGVWWQRHLSVAGDVIAETIEIACVPALLAAHPADIATAAQNLSAALEGSGPHPVTGSFDRDSEEISQ